MEPAELLASLILAVATTALVSWALFVIVHIPRDHLEEWVCSIPRFGRRIKGHGTYIRMRWLWVPRVAIFNRKEVTAIPHGFSVEMEEMECVNEDDGYGFSVKATCEFKVLKMEAMYNKDVYDACHCHIADILGEHAHINFEHRNQTARIIQKCRDQIARMKECTEGTVKLVRLDMSITPSKETAADLRRHWNAQPPTSL